MSTNGKQNNNTTIKDDHRISELKGTIDKLAKTVQSVQSKQSSVSTAASSSVDPHGDEHASGIFMGVPPEDVPSHLAHSIAVHHRIPDAPTGAVRNPKRDHDAPDMVTTIVSSFNVVPDAGGALEVDIYPTLFNPVVPTAGSIFVGGAYVVTNGNAGYGNSTEAGKFAALCSSINCEATEVEIKYVGNITGIQGELSGACFAAGSSQLYTGIARPRDLQTMMSYPGSKSIAATDALHFNLPPSEFLSSFVSGKSGKIVPPVGLDNGAPYNDTEVEWTPAEYDPIKMIAPYTSSPFNLSDISILQPGYAPIMTALTPLSSPQTLATNYAPAFSAFPPAKFDVLPIVRIVGGNLSAGANGSWLITVKQLFTGTVLTHVGDMYNGAHANTSLSVTPSVASNGVFAKTSNLIQKVGAGASTREVTTSEKDSNLTNLLATGARKVGSFLWNSLGGWTGIKNKAISAAELAATAL